MSKKILILGLGRHGKDTAAEYFRDRYGMKFTSSSMFAAEKFLYNSLKEVLNYETFEECYSDRHNHRELWYHLIKAYNLEDRSRLAREMLEQGYDIYVGMRDDEELAATKEEGLFDLIIWVDAEERLGVTEDVGSCKVSKKDVDLVVYNNGDLKSLRRSLDNIFKDL